jgi:hypothetical protein
MSRKVHIKPQERRNTARLHTICYTKKPAVTIEIIIYGES